MLEMKGWRPPGGWCPRGCLAPLRRSGWGLVQV